MDNLSIEKMDRLTERLPDDNILIVNTNLVYRKNGGGMTNAAIKKLADYEDTGLLPEDIEDICNRFAGFLCEMTNNRMSKLNYTLDAMIQCAREAQEDNCLNYCDFQLAEMENRLFTIPFDIGEKVYAIELDRIIPAIVCNYRIDETGLKVICQYENISNVWLTGIPFKTVFKTKVAAEQMFEMMKNMADRTIVRKVIDGTSN